MAATVITRPSGPGGAPLLGSLLDFLRTPLTFLERCASYGDIARFRVANLTAYMVNNPDLIEQVLAETNRNYIKGKNQRDFAPILDDGLPISDGDLWQRQRQRVQPAFNHRRVDAYAATMVEYTGNILNSWQDGKVLNIHEEMMRLTLSVLCKCLFDADVGPDADRIGKAVQVFLETLTARVGQPLVPDRIPTPTNRRLHHAVAEVNGIVERLISERRAEGSDHGDLLSMLLQSKDEDNRVMDDMQLRAEVKAIFLAGNETTAILLAWAIYLISQHPEVETRLAEELDRVLGGRIPTLRDLPQLQYLSMILKETNRVYPPVWIMTREAIRNCNIGPYPVAKGNQVFISQWTMHRDPRYFDRPTQFNPERWTPEAERKLPKYAYFPFGGGPRVCIGSGFAWLEAQLVMAMIYQRYRFELMPEPKVVPLASATLRPRNGIGVRIVARPTANQ